MGRYRIGRRRHDERGDIPIVTIMVTFLLLAVLAMVGAETATATASMVATNRSAAGVAVSNLAGSAANAFYSQLEMDPHYLNDGGSANFPQIGHWSQFAPGGAIVACSASHHNNCFQLTVASTQSSQSSGAGGPAGQQQQAATLSVQAVADCNGTSGSCSTVTVTQHLARRTFLDYLYFYNHSSIDPALTASLGAVGALYPAYQSLDTVNGPVHTNGSSLDSCGSPTFNGPVEVAGQGSGWSPSDGMQHGGCDGKQPQFNAGFTGNAPVLPLPSSDAVLSSIAARGGTPWPGQNGYAFTGNITVTLTGQTMTITGPSGAAYSNVPFPQTGVVYASGNISVSGQNSGALTLAAGGDIIITGNLTYPDGAKNAVTGLEAQGSIQIQDNGSGVTVDAAMLSLTHSIHTAVDPATNSMPVCPLGGNGVPSCPQLTINGGMASQYRGLFGQYDPASGNLTSGFSKNFTYDPRLYHLSPPWMTSQVAGEWMRSSAVSS